MKDLLLKLRDALLDEAKCKLDEAAEQRRGSEHEAANRNLTVSITLFSLSKVLRQVQERL